MARFYGSIGFAITSEVRPGVFKETYKERSYKGDVVKRSRHWQSTEHLNDNLVVNNDISIIADSFATSHFGVMRYVRWKDQVFEITSATIDVDTHRISISLGGVFNVPDDDSSST